MEIEKEIRYKIDEEVANNIRGIAKLINTRKKQVDLTLGYDGFNSLNKYGYVCRVRMKENEKWVEVKKLNKDNSFTENKIKIEKFEDGVNFFKALGMKPYLYMNRYREILEYRGLKIFIDDIELLGQYIEIEYQDVKKPSEILADFMNKSGIHNAMKQPLYGDIFREKIEDDEDFAKKFEEIMKNII